ncbi:MAG: RDD family protein [Anaerolineae bacterium]
MTKMKNGTYSELGGVGSRFMAMLVDGLILGFVTGILFGAGGEVGGGISFVFGVLYNWFFWTRKDGQTPGKMLLGLRVVKADGSRLSDVDALIRAIGYYVSGAVLLLGYIWALIDSENRTWHDILAGTRVIRAE